MGLQFKDCSLVLLVGKQRGQDSLIGPLVLFTGDNGSAEAGILSGEPYVKGKGRKADHGAHVPFVVRAPFLADGGRVSRDLIDFTDVYPTLVELAKASLPEGVVLDGKSFVPSLGGSEDPFQKRSWIYSQLGDFRMIRDWQHILDSNGNFHDLGKDPRQENEVSPLDKIASGRRQRLQMILDRFPQNHPLRNLEPGMVGNEIVSLYQRRCIKDVREVRLACPF